MLPYKTLVSIDKQGAIPIYQQVAERMIRLIQEGRLPPGAFLPSTRELSATLELHRKTVVAAYEELARQDWIQTVPRKGVMVSPNLPVIKPRSYHGGEGAGAYAGNAGFVFPHSSMQPPPILPKAGHRVVLNDGFPDSRESPLALLLRECRRLTAGKAFAKKLMYGPPSGTEHLRDSLATYLAGTRGLGIGPDNLMVTRGAQMALYLSAALLIRPGDKVVVGSPNYYFANLTFEQLGATLVRIPVDDQGIDVQAMAAILKKESIRLLYVVPHHHHPTTVTLSADRRMHLLELIREYNLAVIEDDYDYDFHYASAPILPLASGDHRGNVIYIGSMTKSLALSLRIGFMVAPADFMVEAARLRRIMDLRGDNIMEEALAALLDSGDVDRHLKKTNKLYRERRDLFCSLLEERMSDLISFRKPDGGMAVWATFPQGYSIEALAQRTSALGLLINDGSAYRQPLMKTFGIRMGFASLNEAEAHEAVKLLRKAADQG